MNRFARGRSKSVKRSERSNGLDTALYKNDLFLNNIFHNKPETVSSQVDLKRHEISAKQQKDPAADVSEEQHFILQSTKYLANDQACAFYLSKKNTYPTRHFTNPNHTSFTVSEARRALAKNRSRREGDARYSQSAGVRRRGRPLMGGEERPRPQTGDSGRLSRRQVHFEDDSEEEDTSEGEEIHDNEACGSDTNNVKLPIMNTEAAQNVNGCPENSSGATDAFHDRISEWVPERPILHPRIRRSQSFQPQMPPGRVSGAARVRSQSLSHPDGRIFQEIQHETSAADEKVKSFLSMLKLEGLAADVHAPQPITPHYRHVSIAGPKDYWRRLGAKVLDERKEESRKNETHHPGVEHALLTQDVAKRHSVARKLQNVVKNLMKTKTTNELLEYEKIKLAMSGEQKEMAPQTLTEEDT